MPLLLSFSLTPTALVGLVGLRVACLAPSRTVLPRGQSAVRSSAPLWPVVAFRPPLLFDRFVRYDPHSKGLSPSRRVLQRVCRACAAVTTNFRTLVSPGTNPCALPVPLHSLPPGPRRHGGVAPRGHVTAANRAARVFVVSPGSRVGARSPRSVSASHRGRSRARPPDCLAPARPPPAVEISSVNAPLSLSLITLGGICVFWDQALGQVWVSWPQSAGVGGASESELRGATLVAGRATVGDGTAGAGQRNAPSPSPPPFLVSSIWDILFVLGRSLKKPPPTPPRGSFCPDLRVGAWVLKAT